MRDEINHAIWVAWENHRRNKSLSASLGVPLYQLDYRLPRFIRYAWLPWTTLFLFVRKNPKIIFVQNPSLVLALTAILFGRLTSKPVVVDAHNAGLMPLEGENALLNSVARYLVRRATFTIVSNQGLADFVQRAGGQPCILPDPLPQFNRTRRSDSPADHGVPSVLFICTWAKDEPYTAVLDAARMLNSSVIIWITGNYARAPREVLTRIPENVRLLGFVSEERYLELLMQSDVVLDLTTRENCLVCGAYEAVAAQKPLVTSDTLALRSFFRKGAVYTHSTPEQIAHAIEQALERREILMKETIELKQELLIDFKEKKHDLIEKLVACID